MVGRPRVETPGTDPRHHEHPPPRAFRRHDALTRLASLGDTLNVVTPYLPYGWPPTDAQDTCREYRSHRRRPPRGSASTRPDPHIGQLIGGRYAVQSLIARGGMGRVYLAEHVGSGHVCALKILSPRYEGSRNPEFHKRFLLEAATIAKLSHENTVSIYEHGNDGDTYYIAMEYIDGRTLARAMREDGAFGEARAIRVAQQIGRSVSEAHGYGLVHRDLKPPNILLSDVETRRDFVKVLDFGLVKDITGQGESLTQPGIFMGSPKYMAPEQVLDTGVSVRTDIYSLGVILFEMLAGRVPFDRGAGAATLMAHVNDPIPRLTDKNPDAHVSQPLENVVRRCLEKDPSSRFPAMDDLVRALEEVAPGGEHNVRYENRALEDVDWAEEAEAELEPAEEPDPDSSPTVQPTFERPGGSVAFHRAHSGAPALATVPADVHPAPPTSRRTGVRWLVIIGAILFFACLLAMAARQLVGR